MTAEFLSYRPIIPVETILFLGQEAKAWNWYPYPSRSFWETGKGKPVEVLDNAKSAISLLDEFNLNGHLEAIDLTVGCRWPCETCIRDSQTLSSVMSLDAANTVIQHPDFARALPEWPVCVGYAAEPTDNPHIIEILNSLLQAVMHRKDGFKISVKTNFRKQKEHVVRQLMAMTAGTNKMDLTISLPLNRDNRNQDDFGAFRQANTDLFTDKIHVFDLKNPRWQEIEDLGRVLPGAENPALSEIETFQSRGKGGLLLNPEGLWLMVATTKYESHTPEIFTLVTYENAGLIDYYFGRMNQIMIDFGEAKYRKQMAEATGSIFPPRTG